MKNFLYKKYLFSSIILLLIFWAIDLAWVLGTALVVLLVFVGVNYLLSLIKFKILKQVFKGGFLFFYIIIIAITAKVFCFEVYRVPSSSMENTLEIGDFILVNKLMYGPKLPNSLLEVPFLNLISYLSPSLNKMFSNENRKHTRLSGMSKIKEHDIFVFNMQFGKNNMDIVKRCMGAPGSIIEIKENNVFVNDKEVHVKGEIKHLYSFKTKDSLEILDLKRDFVNKINLRKDDKRDWFNATLSISNKEKLVNELKIDSINISSGSSRYKPKIFPYSKRKKWSISNYGPYKIPYKGMKILLNAENYALYNAIIKKHEKVIIKKDSRGFFIDDVVITEFVFTNNYYFMMGDNRSHSQDSRNWGVVPESSISGKVSRILFSVTDTKMKWNRVNKSVD
ncbi:signal peptidase I [Flavicella sediminum]|uniref:signal peptidase I n=1 Tax=Flavicella sediminum TaxID=2585141 RepID=UPI00140C16FE|nr:signal peptidase I [Flavicella sediminum]